MSIVLMLISLDFNVVHFRTAIIEWHSDSSGNRIGNGQFYKKEMLS